MRNLPAHLHHLHHLHHLALYEQRRADLERQTDAAILVGRAQRRDGRGRFLSRAWLAEAERFAGRDLAWFRHPVTEGK